MILVAFRGLLTRKLRTVLTMIAIVLGVSMVSGTYILTDTINQSFSQIFHQADTTTDVVITGQTVDAGGNSDQQIPGFPARVLPIVRKVPGVAAAEGSINDRAVLVGKNGETLSSTQGAPTLLVSGLSPRFSVLKLVQGHSPSGREVALDESFLSRRHLHLGQRVGVVALNSLEQFTIVGALKFGNVGSIGGASIVQTDLATAQRITGKQGRLDEIRVGAASGVTPVDLVNRIRAAIPSNLRPLTKVQTSQQNANAQAAAVAGGLGALTNILLVFGAIALFVGAFVIFNTFSITVAQRAREFALLRTLGATRGQVLRSVVLEASVVGIVASVIGLFAGFGIAVGINALFKAVGIDLPSSGLTVVTRTVVVALIVGTVVTLVASIIPAVRATRVPPVTALHEGGVSPQPRLRRAGPILGTVLALLGLGLMTGGVFASIDATSQRLTLIGAGALALFIGVAMLSPKLVGPMAWFLGWPVERLTHITGRLARENVVRNPGRTAITAGALMVGLALVGFVTIFAAELKKTALDSLDRELAGTFAIYSDSQSPIPDGVSNVVRRVPGITTVSAVKVASGSIGGIGQVQTNGIQPGTFGKVYRFQWKQGSAATLAALGPHDALVDDSLAKAHHLTVGSTLRATTPVGTHVSFRVAGIYKATDVLPDWCITYRTMILDWKVHTVFAVLANAAPGQNLKTLQHRVRAALIKTYPTAAVHSQQDLKDQNTRSIDLLVNLIYLLLAMSVLVSLFGIINTLVLSIYERTREIGMLRAIGTTRGQLGWIIRWESVITAVIGAVLGLIVGILLAMLVTAGLQSQGLEYALPVGNLLIWVVFAIFFGVVAAIFPARRAARLDVLRAISYE